MSNGDSAGLESADAGGEVDSGDWRAFVARGKAFAKACREWHEHAAAEEIEEAYGRVEAACEASERQRGGEAVYGGPA